jgi:alpha-beta hydrolase superfamily lysophospholipase
MGYAFAVTSYSKTGLAVVQGVADVVDLVGIFKSACENPKNVYLLGVSQGGLVCALALEQHPGVFS